MSEQVKRVCANTLTGLIDLAHEHRHALVNQSFPDNDEGDAFSRVRDSRVARIDRIIEAARAAPVIDYDALHAETEALWSTYIALVDKLGIDTEKAKTADGKPSDVIVSYVDALRAELEEAQVLLRHASSAMAREGMESALVYEIDTFLTAPTVKAEQMQCNCPGGSKPDPSSHAPNCPVRNGEPSPALPVAGVEEVEVVAWQDAENPLYTTAERRVMHEWAGNQYPIVELMTVAQHNRIVAALSVQQSAQPEFCCKHSYKVAKQEAWGARDLTQCKCDHNEYCEYCWPDDFREGGKWHGGFTEQQSAPERVSVPVELLESATCLLELGDMDGPTYRELRALLASHAEGGEV
ncbi:hypothetical protein QM298_10500 [Pseudomonas mendocina]|nr:hypothetical protein [Pseudomonas mendocina]MDV5861337.1 hypothetical protein [Pseudomonas mendocina]